MMQAWARQGQSVLPSTIPSADTLSRIAWLPLIYELAHGDMAVLAPVAGAAAAYSRPALAGVNSVVRGSQGLGGALKPYASQLGAALPSPPMGDEGKK